MFVNKLAHYLWVGVGDHQGGWVLDSLFLWHVVMINKLTHCCYLSIFFQIQLKAV